MRRVLVAIRFLVATWRAASRFIRTASRFCMRRFAARTYRKILAAKVYIYFLNPLQLPTNLLPRPYHPRTRAAASSDFALRRNPRMQRRWWQDGTAQVRRWCSACTYRRAGMGGGWEASACIPVFPPCNEKILIMHLHLSKTVATRRAASFRWVLHQRIAFLPIDEICYLVLGRGGAERSECPP